MKTPIQSVVIDLLTITFEGFKINTYCEITLEIRLFHSFLSEKETLEPLLYNFPSQVECFSNSSTGAGLRAFNGIITHADGLTD